MTKRQELAQQTKHSLMESAVALFETKGFDVVTIEDITTRAGVAKGSFYTYFSNKSDIIVEEFWKIDAYYEAWARENLTQLSSPREKLLAFTQAQMTYIRDVVGNVHLKILYTNQLLPTAIPKVINNPDRQWYKIVEGILAQGQGDGSFRTDRSAARLAVLFNRSVRSVFLDWCIGDGSFDLVEEGLEFVEGWLLGALYWGAEKE